MKPIAPFDNFARVTLISHGSNYLLLLMSNTTYPLPGRREFMVNVMVLLSRWHEWRKRDIWINIKAWQQWCRLVTKRKFLKVNRRATPTPVCFNYYISLLSFTIRCCWWFYVAGGTNKLWHLFTLFIICLLLTAWPSWTNELTILTLYYLMKHVSNIMCICCVTVYIYVPIYYKYLCRLVGDDTKYVSGRFMLVRYITIMYW